MNQFSPITASLDLLRDHEYKPIVAALAALDDPLFAAAIAVEIYETLRWSILSQHATIFRRLLGNEAKRTRDITSRPT